MKQPTDDFGRRHRRTPPAAPLRLAAMVAGGSALVSGMLAGLARMGWRIPAVGDLTAAHGPLMVAGFLGTVISLERAVGLGRPWAYAAPALAGAGSVLILTGAPSSAAALAFLAGAVTLVAVFAVIYRIRPDRPNAVLLAGTLAWTGGVLGWWMGLSVPALVPWWAAFLVLTIAGERLELAHLRPARGLVDAAFLLSAALLGAGALVSAVRLEAGVRLAGVGMVGLGLWLARFDVAWRTVRLQGLTRYIAWCLLPGYAWLALGGISWALGARWFGAGVFYDAMLHMVFVGFVLSMIFGHAPVILPGVLGVTVAFSRRFYLHLALLHASLVLRIAGDLAISIPARQWGGLLNVVAVVLFLLQTALAVRQGRRAAPAS